MEHKLVLCKNIKDMIDAANSTALGEWAKRVTHHQRICLIR